MWNLFLIIWRIEVAFENVRCYLGVKIYLAVVLNTSIVAIAGIKDAILIIRAIGSSHKIVII